MTSWASQGTLWGSLEQEDSGFGQKRQAWGERGVSLASCESHSRPWPRTIQCQPLDNRYQSLCSRKRNFTQLSPLLIPLAILNRALSDFLLPRGALRSPIARARSGDQGKRAYHVPEPCATRHWPVWTQRIYVVIISRAICIQIMSTWPLIVISSIETSVTFLLLQVMECWMSWSGQVWVTPPRARRGVSNVLLWWGQLARCEMVRPAWAAHQWCNAEQPLLLRTKLEMF